VGGRHLNVYLTLISKWRWAKSSFQRVEKEKVLVEQTVWVWFVYLVEYQADLAADEYAASLELYNQSLQDQFGYDDYPYPDDPYGPYPDPYSYNGLADDLGYYP